MRRHLSIISIMLLLWISSCDHEAPVSKASDQQRITITDVDHDPVAKDLLAKLQRSAANGRVSSIEETEAFFKYSDPDSGILNYTFRLPDDSPEYFENLVLSQYADGFYGFIYRYIPDADYTSDEPFRGILQLYNLDNQLIRAFSIPLIQDSITANGRTQIIDRCLRSVTQTCVTTYEVQTVTDYPCHCQYDQKVETGTVCTVSLNMGWCDDMNHDVSPTVEGTYVGEAHSGGASGEAKTPVTKPVVVIPDDDITFYNVKSPCLVKVIKNLMKDNFKNKINQDAKRLFIDAEQAQNLNFKEVDAIVDEENKPIQAQTSSAYPTKDYTEDIDIKLNSSTLPGTSELFQIVAIYHETMHAIFNMSTTYRVLTPEKKHEYMSSSTRTQFMINAVSEIYNRQLSSEEVQQVAALWLFTFSEASSTSNYQESMAHWNLTIDDIFRIGEREEGVVKIIVNGETKIKSLGGPDCSNE